MTAPHLRDHGGRLDAAMARYGGVRRDWIDLSTGINPHPYPPGIPDDTAWTQLPDQSAFEDLCSAARTFWQVPARAGILAAPGVSALIAQMPFLSAARSVTIPRPTYNEHAAAFTAAGITETKAGAAQVVVHPNNPDGRLWSEAEILARHDQLSIIDESFCDVTAKASLVHLTDRPGIVVLKSFGKFWGLAGLRLGFAIAAPDLLTRLQSRLGPWQVSGPALEIGARALRDQSWAENTRARLDRDAKRLDALMTRAGAQVVGGTTLFRLYDVGGAAQWQNRLARAHILSRTFPYTQSWLRLGLPGPETDWARLEATVAA